MNESPIACSLRTDELARRLEEIESVGAESLLSQRLDGEAQVLRFQADARTRRRLEAIVAAEAECCPFLELDLKEEGEQLVLTIAAPPETAPVAAELAGAFARRRPELSR